MHWLLLHANSNLLDALERLASHTEEHRWHRSICDSDHQINANFITASVFPAGQFLAMGPESKSEEDPPALYARPAGLRIKQLGRTSSKIEL
jgi:hypothetical protein